MKLNELVQQIKAVAKNINTDIEISLNNISIDSRTVKPFQMFLPIVGDNFDGHDFISDAFKKGATLTFVSKNWWSKNQKQEIPVIIVEDTLKTLQFLAKIHRKNYDIPVIAVTGSNGKTTTKDMIASVLSQKFNVIKSQASYNNEIGLPLTLLSITENTEVVVVEMGMRGLKQIEELTLISLPTIGVITNIAPVHLELLGSIENIAQAKGELIRNIGKKGKVFLNNEDDFCLQMSDWTDADIFYYGFKKEFCDCYVKADNIETSFISSKYRLIIDNDEIDVSLPIPGKYNILNSLAAAGVAYILGLDFKTIRKGLAECVLTEMRLQINENSQGTIIINDAYNANPVSMSSSIDVLSLYSGRKIAVLGDMYELGDFDEEGHLLVGEKIYKKNIDFLITIGEKASFISRGAKEAGMNEERIAHFKEKKAAELFLLETAKKDDCLLFKASRAAKLDELAKRLLGTEEG